MSDLAYGTIRPLHSFPNRTSSPAYISIPSHRFPSRRFSLAACWLLS
jgi:hypothetical protein